MADLAEFDEYGVDIDSIYQTDHRSLKDTILYRLTFFRFKKAGPFK